MFYEAYERALQNGGPFVKDTSMDIFANLFELMQFSAKLINRLRHFQLYSAVKLNEVKEGPCANIECDNSYIGKAIVAMAEDFVIFLRCAMDYSSNRKILRSSEKGYEMYKQVKF
jgi:hypothetical protein